MTRHFKCGRTQCVCVNEMFGPERPGGVGRSDNEGKEYGSEEGLGAYPIAWDPSSDSYGIQPERKR